MYSFLENAFILDNIRFFYVFDLVENELFVVIYYYLNILVWFMVTFTFRMSGNLM